MVADEPVAALLGGRVALVGVLLGLVQRAQVRARLRLPRLAIEVVVPLFELRGLDSSVGQERERERERERVDTKVSLEHSWSKKKDKRCMRIH